MRSLPFGFTLIVAALTACSPSEQGASSAIPERCALLAEEVEVIRGMTAAHQARVLAADWEGMIQSFSPDFVSMPANQAELVGHDAVLAHLKTYPRVAEYESTVEEVDGCGDVAYSKALYSLAVQSTESAELVRDTGRYIWILRKNSEGRWVVTHNIGNSDQSLVTGR